MILEEFCTWLEKTTLSSNPESSSPKKYKGGVKTISSEMGQKYESIKLTERESLIKSRIGQGKFRNEIMQKYAGTCIISGITDSRLLVASHIKPWSVSDNENRLSKENGILLNYLYDRMFDLGLISFTNEGKILISNELNAENKALSGLKKEAVYPLKFTSVLLQNMEYHRDIVFLRG